jgi:hypothetical protein
MRTARVVLVNLVNREILSVDVGRQLGLKRRPNPTQRIPVDAAEEGVLLEFAGATETAEAVFGIADQARCIVSHESWVDSAAGELTA